LKKLMGDPDPELDADFLKKCKDVFVYIEKEAAYRKKFEWEEKTLEATDPKNQRKGASPAKK